MIERAKWIWEDDEKTPRNKWVYFKKEFVINKGKIEDAHIEITADSKYLLYINNERINKGPNRAFPKCYQYDKIDISRYLKEGKNSLIIKVHHFGMDTHQYILGRAGLIFALKYKVDNKEYYIYSDEGISCTNETEMIKENIRISAGREYSELIDARKKSKNYKNSKVLGSYGIEPWGELEKSYMPLPTYEEIMPKRIVLAQYVKEDGTLVNVDLHDVFSGEIQKPEFLYLVTNINSSKETECVITFPYSRLWCCYGQMYINNKVYASDMNEYEHTPIAKGPKSYKVKLDKGKNMMAMRIDGIVMGVHVPMHFGQYKGEIEFNSAFGNLSSFDCVTTLLNKDSNKIELEKGEWINHPKNPNIDDETKKEALLICDKSLKNSDTESIKKWVRPINKKSISYNHPQQHTMMQKKVDKIPIDHNMEQIVLNSPNSSLIKGGKEKNIVLDFEKEVSGYIFFEIDSAKSGEIIDFSGYEYINWQGNIQEMDGVNNAFRYITKDGKQIFVSAQIRAFRYLSVTFRNTNDINIRCVGIKQSTYPVTNIGQFRSSDSLLNEIYDISKRTTKLCMMDTFVDCPGHEQSFWLGDFRNEALIAMYLYNADSIIEQCFRVGIGSLTTSVLPKASCPSEPQGIIPTWTLLWMMAYYEFYLYKNTDAIKKYYEEMKKCLEVFIDSIDPKNDLACLKWNDMLDWAPMDIGAGKYTANLNAELYKVLVYFSKAAIICGKKEESKRYSEIADKLKKAITKELWCEDKKAFCDSIDQNGIKSKMFSVQANSMVYACEVPNLDQLQVLEEYLEKGFPNDFQKINSPFASFFYYEACEKAKKYSTILNDIKDKWGQMLDLGATTCFETFVGWEKNDIPTRSHCHAWSSAPAFFLPRILLGIRPLKPGYKRFEVKPRLGSLRYVFTTVPVPFGMIKVYAKKNKEKLDVTIEKPKELNCIIDNEKFNVVIKDI